MTKLRRKFTPEERLSILQESSREGRPETLRKYNISPSLFDRWRKKYLYGGFESGLIEFKANARAFSAFILFVSGYPSFSPLKGGDSRMRRSESIRRVCEAAK